MQHDGLWYVRANYSDVKKSLPVNLGRLSPDISVGYCFDSHPRIYSFFKGWDCATNFLKTLKTLQGLTRPFFTVSRASFVKNWG